MVFYNFCFFWGSYMLYVVAASAEFLFSFVVATCCVIFLDSLMTGSTLTPPSRWARRAQRALRGALEERGKRKRGKRGKRRKRPCALCYHIFLWFSFRFPCFLALSLVGLPWCSLTILLSLAFPCFPLFLLLYLIQINRQVLAYSRVAMSHVHMLTTMTTMILILNYADTFADADTYADARTRRQVRELGVRCAN